MRYIILLFFAFLFYGCGVYNVSTSPKVKISKVLTITSTGDTLAIPIKEFQRHNYNNVFDNYRFNFNYGYGWNNFYPYNLYRPNSWYYRDWYYQPPIYNYSLELPNVNKPRVYVNGRRGSNNSETNNRIILKPNNNDQINRSNTRIYLRPEGGNNGRRSWSGENIPAKPVKPIITPPSQPRQIHRGSGSSGVQQSISRGSSSGQRGGGTIRQQN